MTIFIPWYAWPIAVAIGSFGGAIFLTPREQGYMDFLPGLIAIGWLVVGAALTVGLLVGHFTAH